MPIVILHRWTYIDGRGNKRRTSYLLTEAEALERLGPAAQPVPGTCEQRDVPDDPAKLSSAGLYRNQRGE